MIAWMPDISCCDVEVTDFLRGFVNTESNEIGRKLMR